MTPLPMTLFFTSLYCSIPPPPAPISHSDLRKSPPALLPLIFSSRLSFSNDTLYCPKVTDSHRRLLCAFLLACCLGLELPRPQTSAMQRESFFGSRCHLKMHIFQEGFLNVHRVCLQTSTDCSSYSPLVPLPILPVGFPLSNSGEPF